MDQWKKDIVDDIIEQAKTKPAIRLKVVAEAHGKTLMARQDVQEVKSTLKRMLPGFHPVEKPETPLDTIFQSLYFVKDGVEI